MNEQQMKKGLRLLADDGWFGVKITDEFVDGFLRREWESLSDELMERSVSRLRIRIQDDAIRRAYPAVDPKVVSFGRFIWAIREIARITRAEIGDRLGKREEFVQRVEQGDVTPVHIPPPEFADLMTLFQINLKDAVQLICASDGFERSEQENASSVSGLEAQIWHDHRTGDGEKTLDVFEGWQRRRPRRHSQISKEEEAFFISLRKELARRRRPHRLL
jgi:transcriptional regulator with XRE-family HTH domain